MKFRRADGKLVEIGEGGDQVYELTLPTGERWVWSVAAATAFAQARGEPQRVSLAGMGMTLPLLARQYPDLDVAYALTTDLTRPLLFIPIGDRWRLIDGSHRACKALLLGIDEMSAYFLTQQEADDCLLARLPPEREPAGR